VSEATRSPQWGSDVIAEMLRRLDVEYASLEPGSSFRGLHDSIVNYLGNTGPRLIMANHEEIAVAVAHGYAKVRGRAMAAIVHANVGLMHATMGVFSAYADRQPLLLLGGNGPMDATQRRPWIDWVHTTHGQGSFVRDITKWEHQPASVAALPEAMLRAWQTVHTPPAGPAYVVFDAVLQEQAVTADFALPDVARYPLPSAPAPDPAVVSEAARWLVGAESPVILLGRGVPTEAAWRDRIALAEALGAAVLPDVTAPTSFPTAHHLMQAESAQWGNPNAAIVLRAADVVLSLDHADVTGTLRAAGALGRARIIHVSLDRYALRSAVQDQQELVPADLPILALTDRTVAALLQEIPRAQRDLPRARGAARSRTEAHRRRHAELGSKAKADLDAAARGPLSVQRIALELRATLGGRARDAVLARKTITWPASAWPAERALADLGNDGSAGVGSGPGMAVGSALALRGSGRLPVAILGDGDTLSSVQAVWTAAHERIPLLVIVANNQTYRNDEVHQTRVARERGRPLENAWIGQRMTDPAIDYATVARGLGAEGIGPVDDAAMLPQALARGIATVDEGGVAVVDVRIAR
jgi:thiamine pyrophosphate-dependent acetolactate synthase large subunit-like protein